MIITRTPFRVSFAGGGSDIRGFYSRHGYGAVVSAAIQKYMYIAIHPYFHDKIRIKYSKTEDVKNIDDIQHPLVRECLRKVKIERGLEIASFADVAAGTGLGSSSAFTVGLLHALYAYKGIRVSKAKLAEEACEIEIDTLGEPIGKQDQYSAAFGGLNYIRFDRNEKVSVRRLPLTKAARMLLEKNLYLYYIGGERRSGDILEEQKNSMLHPEKFQKMKAIVGFADELKGLLRKGRVDSVGDILYKGWVYKKSLVDSISTERIDDLYNHFIQKGAVGGKLLGAGGTGFLLIYAYNHGALKKYFRNKTLSFAIDTKGSKVLFRG